MATADHDSSLELGVGPVPLGGDGAVAGIWLDGDVLACACPECGAPMSIRLWLMVADCWRCGTSIELTEEQERLALQLLREHEEAKREEGRVAVAAITPTMLPTRPAARPAPQPDAEPKKPAEKPAPEMQTAAPPPSVPRQATPRQRRREAATTARYGARARIREIYEKGAIGVALADLLGELPAWLVSLVVHLVALLLLSLWFDEPRPEPPVLTLSPSISPENLETALGLETEPMVEPIEFDNGGGPVETHDLADLKSAGEAHLEIGQIDPIIDHPLGPLPSVTRMMSPPTPISPSGNMLLGRDPQVRTQLAYSAGGTSQTEAAVARGLIWLARHQSPDGSWSLDRFQKTEECHGQCGGAARGSSDHAATALALLPFLGAGQTHVDGRYTEEVLKGLMWLVEHQREDGDLRGPGFGRMYAHGQAAIVLCEAYALTGDPQLRGPAQLALDFIVKAQHRAGGWRYDPGQAGDTSVVGWQLMALNSGRMAHLHVPDETLASAVNFLNEVQTDKPGGTYSYMRGHGTSHVMTAEALLCRQYLGWPKDHPGMQAGVKFLLDQHMPSADEPLMYYWYYATQAMHHMGGKTFDTWNTKMRQVLVNTQCTKGHEAGSWDPRGGHANQGGRLYMTALATCTLEVYYRFLPLYNEKAVTRSAVQTPIENLDLFEMSTTPKKQR